MYLAGKMGSFSYAKSFVPVLFLLIRTINGIPPNHGGNLRGDDVITVNSDNSSSSEISLENRNETLQNVSQNVSETLMQNSANSTSDPFLVTNSSSLEDALPPLPPQKLVQSPELTSLLSSSESLQNFLKTRGFSIKPGQAGQPPSITGLGSPQSIDPVELNQLLARLKPKQGRFDPALLDIINNNQDGGAGGGFLPNFPTIFGNLLKQANNQRNNAANSPQPEQDVDIDENADIWSPSLPPRSQPPRRNRFSSKFSKGPKNDTTKTLTTTTPPPPETGPRPLPLPNNDNIGPFSPSLNPSPQIYEPFSHITDPNLRNHRLYDWELEKNFTTLDQMEDLLAQSSEHGTDDPSEDGGHPGLVRVKAPPGLSTSNGWIPRPRPGQGKPKSRPVSMEGTQFDSSGDFENDKDTALPADTFLQFPTSEQAKDPEEGDPGVDFDLEPEDDISQPFNLLRPRPRPKPVTTKTRDRAPLRESSTENLVFSHRGPALSSDKRRLSVDRYRSEEGQGPPQGIRSQEVEDDLSSINGRKRKLGFRPSPADKVLSSAVSQPPVFVDPDQDFFTSTIRTSNKLDENKDKNANEEEPPRFIRPMRRLPGNKDKNDYPRTEKRKRRPISEEAITSLDRDPRPYPPPEEEQDDNNDDNRHRDRPPYRPSAEPDYQLNSNPTRKSDRILVHPDYQGPDPQQDQLNTNSQSEIRPTYYNFYPVREFGPASNEQEFAKYPQPSSNDGESYPEQSQHSQHDLEEYPEQYPGYNNGGGGPGKSGPVLGHNGEQIYAGGYDGQFHHPFAAADSQPEYSSYSPNSNEGWSNTYWILGGLIALSALTAFILPALLNSMGRNGKIRNDLQDDLEYTDEQGTTNPSNTAASASTTTSFVSSLLGGSGDKNKKKPKPASNLDEYDTSDPTADSDLWSEIKGVYNDVVKIVRGDYGGIVDKLSGSGLGFNKDKDKDKIGPNIVYRDDDSDLIEEDDDGPNRDRHHDELEDDFDYESVKNKKPNFGNRKGKAKPKKDKVAKKNRNITSSINYVVSNSSPGSVQLAGKHGAVTVSTGARGVEETSRAAPQAPVAPKPMFNDTMAGFYLGGGGPYSSSSSSRPFSLFTSPSAVGQSTSSNPGDGDSFMGEWAKVQLIGS